MEVWTNFSTHANRSRQPLCCSQRLFFVLLGNSLHLLPSCPPHCDILMPAAGYTHVCVCECVTHNHAQYCFDARSANGCGSSESVAFPFPAWGASFQEAAGNGNGWAFITVHLALWSGLGSVPHLPLLSIVSRNVASAINSYLPYTVRAVSGCFLRLKQSDPDPPCKLPSSTHSTQQDGQSGNPRWKAKLYGKSSVAFHQTEFERSVTRSECHAGMRPQVTFDAVDQVHKGQKSVRA